MQVHDEWVIHWLEKQARLHYWRVAQWHDLDDLIQDGYWLFYRVVNKYPQITTRRHIMGLFQRAFINHMHNLATRRTKLTEITVDIEEGYTMEETLEGLSMITSPIGTEKSLVEVIEDAPETIRMVLKLIMREPELLKAPNRRRVNGTRETINERICRRLNIKFRIDLVTPTRNYLRGPNYRPSGSSAYPVKKRHYKTPKTVHELVQLFNSLIHSNSPGMLEHRS